MHAITTAVNGTTICATVSTIKKVRIVLGSSGRYLSLFAACALFIANAGTSQIQEAQSKVQRTPLERRQPEYKSPGNYAPRENGYDRKTGKPISYDHKPRLELLDQQFGKHLLTSIGYD